MSSSTSIPADTPIVNTEPASMVCDSPLSSPEVAIIPPRSSSLNTPAKNTGQANAYTRGPGLRYGPRSASGWPGSQRRRPPRYRPLANRSSSASEFEGGFQPSQKVPHRGLSIPTDIRDQKTHRSCKSITGRLLRALSPPLFPATMTIQPGTIYDTCD
jgi:hypothetical protein